MKRKLLFLVAFAISLVSFGVLGSSQALAATKTWTGGGGDTNMMTAGNWAGGAPSAGDDLVFPVNITNRTANNNFTAATSFNSITFSGTATGNSDYTISGNSMTLVAGITNSMTGSFALYQTLSLPIILNGTQTFQTTGTGSVSLSGTLSLGSSALTFGKGMAVSGVISGSGTITKTGADDDLLLTGNNTYTGATTISAGRIVVGHVNALGASSSGTTVSSGASVYLFQGTGDVTYTEPFTLAGTGGSNGHALSVGNSYGMGGIATPPYATSTLSGTITLTANTALGAGDRNGKITGAIVGSYTLSLSSTSNASFEIASSANGSATANSTLSPPVKETVYADNLPGTYISINTNETAIVTGTYGDVYIGYGGTLKGTGTVGAVSGYGKIAPGLSPGCLTTGDLSLTGSLDIEVGGTTACTNYDQLKVTGTVTLNTDAVLNVSRYNGFKFVAGQKYTIIANDGTDAVSGTFKNLAEGATFTVDGYVLKISYVGGDGNDVELTVVSVPASPVTGFGLIKNNPLLSVVLITGAAGIIALMARNRKFAFRTTKR